MNFDEIKKAMNHDDTNLQIPLSVSEIKSSETSIKTVRKWIAFDILSIYIIAIVLIYFMFFGEMYPLAKVVFSYTAFISIYANFGAIVFQFSIYQKLKIHEINSKKTIEKYIILIKTYIGFSRIVFTGLCAAIMIPAMIATIGTEQYTENYVNDLIKFKLSNYQLNRSIAYVLLISAFGYYFSGWTYKKTLEKECNKLEKILDQF